MNLVHNWERILKHAWSIRLDLLNIVLSAALSAIPILTGTTLVAPLTLAIISVTLTVLSMGVRFIKQEKVSGTHEPPQEE